MATNTYIYSCGNKNTYSIHIACTTGPTEYTLQLDATENLIDVDKRASPYERNHSPANDTPLADDELIENRIGTEN